jgi:hypothetical protein
MAISEGAAGQTRSSPTQCLVELAVKAAEAVRVRSQMDCSELSAVPMAGSRRLMARRRRHPGDGGGRLVVGLAIAS